MRIGETQLWIYKIVPGVYHDPRIVVETIQLVIEVAILQIRKPCPAFAELLLPFRIGIIVDLDSRLVVITVIIGEAAVHGPYHISIVFPVIPIPAAAEK